MRGELRKIHPVIVRPAGSSPHAWGTQTPADPFSRWIRFIPTCVGNSNCTIQPSILFPVHPHMRGELLAYAHLLVVVLRFIPTCVGNSIAASKSSPDITVHPHMRGELSTSSMAQSMYSGSSPHALGTRYMLVVVDHAHRFIPTCVGNSMTPLFRCRPGPVHPHMRGELELHRGPAFLLPGSSPHAWGTLSSFYRSASRYKLHHLDAINFADGSSGITTGVNVKPELFL